MDKTEVRSLKTFYYPDRVKFVIEVAPCGGGPWSVPQAEVAGEMCICLNYIASRFKPGQKAMKPRPKNKVA